MITLRQTLSLLGALRLTASLVSCGRPSPASTPEEALTRRVTAHVAPATAKTLHIHGSRPWLDTKHVVVLFSFDVPAEKLMLPYHSFGYRVVEQTDREWVVNQAVGQDITRFRSPAIEPDAAVDYAQVAGDDYAVIFGWARLPNATMVEATFDTGQTVRDSISDTAFILAVPDATAACTYVCWTLMVGRLFKCDYGAQFSPREVNLDS